MAIITRRRVFAPAPAAGKAYYDDDDDYCGGAKRKDDETAAAKNARRRFPMSARQAATMAYVEENGRRKDKLLVSSSTSTSPRVRLRADAMRCLAVPLSRDGPERQITGVLLDAAVELLRQSQSQSQSQSGLRNGRRVLLESVEEQDWLEYVSSTADAAAAEDMAATAKKYLNHDIVFFPVNYKSHFFVAALDVAAGEYQILDSSNHGRRFGIGFYAAAMSRIRDGVARCVAAAAGVAVAGGGLGNIRMVDGLPAQTDESSCGFFAIKCMELWDGEKLERGFTMDDVHELQAKLAEELIFWEMNEMQDVKAEIEAMARKMMMSCHNTSSDPIN
uniref:Ubiquitin-like protease family profile domain-containing protein n=1 Tax=Leersia perrieri TaxID=77586 RepID=A0A0D9XKJ2_9ORYZ